jgi:uncharacterized protein (TIGR02271 family)
MKEPEDPLEIPVVQEELRVEKRAMATGKVVVRKTVQVRDELVDLPLASEELEVRRVPKNEFVARASPVRQEGGTTIVPVFEEVLVVEKRLLLKEEVHLVRRLREQHRPQRVEVRTEEVTVERVEAGESPSEPMESRES